MRLRYVFLSLLLLTTTLACREARQVSALEKQLEKLEAIERDHNDSRAPVRLVIVDDNTTSETVRRNISFRLRLQNDSDREIAFLGIPSPGDKSEFGAPTCADLWEAEKGWVHEVIPFCDTPRPDRIVIPPHQSATLISGTADPTEGVHRLSIDYQVGGTEDDSQWAVTPAFLVHEGRCYKPGDLAALRRRQAP